MSYPTKAYQNTPLPGSPARTEAWALLEAARELNQAKDGPMEQLRAALRRNWRLWTIFQASLLDPDCTVPNQIRSNLLGLADFIDRQTAELLGARDAQKIAALIHINRQISEGLLEGLRASAARATAAAPAPNLVSLSQSV